MGIMRKTANPPPLFPPPATGPETADETADGQPSTPAADGKPPQEIAPKGIKEIGGPKGPEPTRYGDWEVGGRCTDF
jgi:hypothetical protein